MKFKTTLALTLALGTFAVTGAAQEAPDSGSPLHIETVSKPGFFGGGFFWLPGESFGKNLFSKQDEPAKSAGVDHHPSLLKRVSLYFRSSTQTAEPKPVRAANVKTGRLVRTGAPAAETNYGYIFARGLDDIRSSIFTPKTTGKSDRRVSRSDERRPRLARTAPARETRGRFLTQSEETHLQARLAHGDVDRFRQDALAARTGPDRGQVSWIGKAIASFGIQTPVTSDRKYGKIVERYARAYGVPVELAHAVIKVESNYREDIRGRAGEIGLMQIKPATARLMGYSGSNKDLFDPENNIKYGMLYLAKAHKLSGGTTCGTILKYNAGHGARRMNPVSARYCAKVKKHLQGV